MSLAKQETFLCLDGKTDKKNILLRSDACLNEEDLRKLDCGKLTLEDLDEMLAKKAQIFKYSTQITIHAKFPGKVNNRRDDYAFLINNKNGSVGIRYGAIDECKRVKLSKYLSYEGFHYTKKSTEHDFTLTKSFANRDEANNYIAELKSRYDYNALRSLIYGHINISGFVYKWRYYVALSIRINAIPKKNISGFMKQMRCKSEAEIEEIEKKRDEERKLQQEQWTKKYEQRVAKENEEARKKRTILSSRYQKEFTTVRSMPSGTCSLCVLTDKARLVVIKQFFTKSGKKVIKIFLQKEYDMKDYQKWNDEIPHHAAKDTYKMSEATLQKYMAEGMVFQK